MYSIVYNDVYRYGNVHTYVSTYNEGAGYGDVRARGARARARDRSDESPAHARGCVYFFVLLLRALGH
jgi:hypothetical protein